MHNMAKCFTLILIKTVNDQEDKLTKRLIIWEKTHFKPCNTFPNGQCNEEVF